MNVRNCRKCGKIFNYVVGLPLCSSCLQVEENKFQDVKNYVYEHKGADITEVSEACDVEPSQIRQWVREDRLQFSDDCPIRIPCERCGAMIRSGRFCDKCSFDLNKELGSIKKGIVNVTVDNNTKKSSGKDKMRFL